MTADNGAFCLNTKHKQHTDFTVQERRGRGREGGLHDEYIFSFFCFYILSRSQQSHRHIGNKKGKKKKNL